MRERGWTRAQLAKELDVHTGDIDALVFGLAFVSLTGGRAEPSSGNPLPQQSR
jgi:hypothetical protein